MRETHVASTGSVVRALIAFVSAATAAEMLSSWDKTRPVVGMLAKPFAKGVEARARANAG